MGTSGQPEKKKRNQSEGLRVSKLHTSLNVPVIYSAAILEERLYCNHILIFPDPKQNFSLFVLLVFGSVQRWVFLISGKSKSSQYSFASSTTYPGTVPSIIV